MAACFSQTSYTVTVDTTNFSSGFQNYCTCIQQLSGFLFKLVMNLQVPYITLLESINVLPKKLTLVVWYYFQLSPSYKHVSYSDFCVRAFAMDEGQSSCQESGMYILSAFSRIPVFGNECKSESEQFFKTCLHSEIIDNWYTRSTVTT